MNRYQVLRLAAISGLILVSLTDVARAQSYDLASDWLSTYPTTASLNAATQATWGAGNAWSAGEMSWNWTNQQAVVGGSSLQTFTSYYTPNTVGDLTSSNTVLQTFTYTVPFQAYQFDPGSTIDQQVGQTFTQQVASGKKPEGPSSEAITLPTGFVSGGASSGYVIEVGAVKQGDNVDTAVNGFAASGYSAERTFNDGDGPERATTSGIFYNYGSTNATNNEFPELNFPRSATSDTLTLENLFGPSYVAWTAPTTGTINVNASAWDPFGNSPDTDGSPSVYVVTSTLGPANPILSASSFVAPGDTNGAPYEMYGNMQSQPSSTVPGSTITDLGAQPGYTSALGLNWTGVLSVSAGEVLYFIDDPGHNQVGGHGNPTTGDLTDTLAVQAQISYTPEPSSCVLAGMGVVGSALILRRRRRSPATLAGGRGNSHSATRAQVRRAGW